MTVDWAQLELWAEAPTQGLSQHVTGPWNMGDQRSQRPILRPILRAKLLGFFQPAVYDLGTSGAVVSGK